jgi:hypothetical protein
MFLAKHSKTLTFPAIISKDKIGMSPYGSDGVDVTLVRWMLSLTPAERLAVLQDFLDFIEEVKAANDTQSDHRHPADVA